jgi:hypothetical protein
MSPTSNDYRNPKAVVLAAYEAASRGQYAKANGLLAPKFLRTIREPRASAFEENYKISSDGPRIGT